MSKKPSGSIVFLTNILDRERHTFIGGNVVNRFATSRISRELLVPYFYVAVAYQATALRNTFTSDEIYKLTLQHITIIFLLPICKKTFYEGYKIFVASFTSLFLSPFLSEYKFLFPDVVKFFNQWAY